MEPTDQPQPAGGQSPDRTQQIIIVLLVIVVLLLGGLLLAQCGDDTEPTTTATPTTATPTTTVPSSSTAAPATTVPPSTTAAPTTTVPPSTTTVPVDACNGSALALTGAIDEADSLYLYDLDTASLSNLLPDGSSAPRSPVWSSECDAIFFVSEVPGGDSSLVQQIDLVSLDVSTLFEYDDRITHLAVHDGDGAFEFTTVEDDMTFVTNISLGSGEFQTHLELGPHLPWDGVQDLSLSPSGMLILYQNEFNNLNIVSDSPELAAQVPLGALTMNPFQQNCCALSPDGQMLAIEILLGDYGDTGGETGMVLLDLATGDTETFTKDGDSPYFYGSINSPSWASDGSQVVFLYDNSQYALCSGEGCYEFIGGTIELWLAAPGAPFATLIASFNKPQPSSGHEVAWMPGG